MSGVGGIEAVVLDVLGTMVDEPGGLREAVREAVPACDEASVERLLTVWRGHVEHEQRRVGEGLREYANSEVLDREAARRVADRAGVTDPEAVERLATAGQRLEPWADSQYGLMRLAQRFPVLGLSNASRTALVRLSAHAGLRWHHALSAEEAQAYKPAERVYRLAVKAAGCAPERMLMVAAHAWDLRGAQALGMRTAYVERPGGDPPKRTDTFDASSASLDALAAALE
ncbi:MULTISPECIES: haloacid dehalogenase type II [unclassified Nocardiopsis]|uniref:haloacid dehalogenase type II n=1 Tax=unclassified Nocardiopsis TaxID=2649073 RepID=UPI00135AFE85|nr:MULTISPECIES: haloacid dehalogenase type II [unclassified Nocardiopsis]